ncbi:MAG: amidohydrolase family protein [Planctomycetota bacterium]|nr:amidohydrolase family protein [Planctomycetota bacterium]
MVQKIIDAHQHLEDLGELDKLTETYHRLGVVKSILLGHPPNRQSGNNEVVLAAHKREPDLYVPFVGFDLDRMNADELRRFRDDGFIGIKFIGPEKPYNDPAYFSVYEKACELGMPGLFHLGIVANFGPWRDCDSNQMRPIHLDHIARRIPEWKIIGAHLGNPWYEEATMSCRWNPNLFFDLSGSTLKKKTPEFLSSLLWWSDSTAYKSPDRTSAWEKIVFGSDVGTDQIEDVINDYRKLMDALQMPDELREKIWCSRAAGIIGIDE